jgi:hypothetical protein
MPKKKDWELIFAPKGKLSYKSTVDHPSCLYYKELFDLNPNSKVILTVRDSPKVWYESAKETIYLTSEKSTKFPMSIIHWIVPSMRNFFKMVHAEVWNNRLLFDGKFDDQKQAEKVYLKWIEDVKKNIPKSKLLVFNAKEGWGPLCKFLGVPVPDCPFPKANDRQEFLSFYRKRIMVSTFLTFLSGFTIGGICYTILRSFIVKIIKQ